MLTQRSSSRIGAPRISLATCERTDAIRLPPSLHSHSPPETRHSLFAAIIFSGACAVFISYTTAWCIRATSSTTYSMVGALNKLPLALSGMVFFHDPATLGSTSAIGVGFIAG